MAATTLAYRGAFVILLGIAMISAYLSNLMARLFIEHIATGNKIEPYKITC
ncbi:MAG TPA: hypothetical protein VK102_03000 [Sphingobacterium sp.]|nr:hypothetical protein [Sphingobacterium sp.]